MENWFKKNVEKILYGFVLVLVVVTMVLFALRLSDVISIGYWDCLKPISIPSLLAGFALFIMVLWRTMIEIGNGLERLWGLVFKD